MSNDPTVPVFRWNTDEIPVHHRFDQYVEMVRNNLICVTTRCEDPRRFRTDMQVSALGRLKVASIAGSAKRSARTLDNIKASGDRAFHLVAGRKAWEFESGAQRIRLGGTDLVLIDTERVYASRMPEDFLNHTVSIPPAIIRQWLPDVDRIVGMKLRGDSGWGHMLSSLVDQLVQLDAAQLPLPAAVFEDQLGALVSLAAPHGAGRAVMRQATRTQLRDRVVDAIRQRCTDVGLTASQVAADAGVSPRTLHRVLAAGGETFGALLLAARSEVAHRMLLSPRFAEYVIADIAFRAGFADESHFSRTMRARYGHPPARLRRMRS
ncbi:helix-turn-helix domain-containing protein [Bordetella genomosp. 9]|nr:helix-turn-helix domain-containing protein [Bordetella genomosp. 9]